MKNNELVKRLENLNLESVEYKTDGDLGYDESYISDVVSAFVGGISLDTAINETLDGYIDSDLDSLIENSASIESDIDDYIRDVGVSSFRDALTGGQSKYYKRQLYSNCNSIYRNALVEILTDLKDDLLKSLNEDKISEDIVIDTLPILYTEDSMDVIESFTSHMDDISYIDSIDELTEKFNEFINSNIREN